MRKHLQILFIALSFITLKLNAQCPNPITFSVNSTAPTCSTCCDGSIVVTNIQNGCPAYNIQITPSATMSTFGTFNNLCSGTYTVKVMDGGCCGSAVMICSINYSTIPCPTPITYSVQTTPETCTGCCDGTAQVINLSGGCPAYTYVWQPGALVTSSVSSICFGIYTVTVSDAGCCPSVSQTFTMQSSSTTSIIENNLDNSLSIFPNPTNSILNIVDNQNQFQNATIQIKNYLGQIVFTTPFTNQIDLQSLSSGMYFLTLQTQVYTKAIKVTKL